MSKNQPFVICRVMFVIVVVGVILTSPSATPLKPLGAKGRLPPLRTPLSCLQIETWIYEAWFLGIAAGADLKHRLRDSLPLDGVAHQQLLRASFGCAIEGV